MQSAIDDLLEARWELKFQKGACNKESPHLSEIYFQELYQVFTVKISEKYPDTSNRRKIKVAIFK